PRSWQPGRSSTRASPPLSVKGSPGRSRRAVRSETTGPGGGRTSWFTPAVETIHVVQNRTLTLPRLASESRGNSRCASLRGRTKYQGQSTKSWAPLRGDPTRRRFARAVDLANVSYSDERHFVLCPWHFVLLWKHCRLSGSRSHVAPRIRGFSRRWS